MRYRFNSLQCFRGLAALGVVFYHTAMSTNAFIAEIPTKLNSIFHFGLLGVDLFFVLSGFIILSSHFDDDKSVSSLKTYCLKRFVRIFPPYWPVSVVMILSYIFLPDVSRGERGEFSLLSSLFLLPDSAPPALSVAWTLIHEILFYMLFTLFFFSNRLFVGAVIIWVSTITFVFWVDTEIILSPVLQRLLNPINLDFIIGMYVAYIARTIPKHFGGVLVLMGTVLLILLLLWPSSFEYRFLYGVSFAAILLGSSLVERQLKFKSPSWLVRLGDASYSIYLIHNPLVSLTSRVVSRVHGFTGWWLGMLVGVVASVIVGILYNLLIEKPLIHLFRQKFLPRTG